MILTTNRLTNVNEATSRRHQAPAFIYIGGQFREQLARRRRSAESGKMGDIEPQRGVTRPSLPEKEDSFSMAGCGFLGVYHIGAISCLRRHVPHLLENAKFAGASAGALLACCMVCDVPLSKDFCFC